jgi:hypothetical protein
MIESDSHFVEQLQTRLDGFNYTLPDGDEFNQTYVQLRDYQLFGIRWLIERYKAKHGASK